MVEKYVLMVERKCLNAKIVILYLVYSVDVYGDAWLVDTGGYKCSNIFIALDQSSRKDKAQRAEIFIMMEKEINALYHLQHKINKISQEERRKLLRSEQKEIENINSEIKLLKANMEELSTVSDGKMVFSSMGESEF